MREVTLRLGDYLGKNCASVSCAVTSDFILVIESYGYYFLPKARKKYNAEYENTDEYILRKQVEKYGSMRIREDGK